MAKYYQKNLFDPSAMFPYPISRTKIELFIECPRCFYRDRRLGISRPSMPGFTLNTAVDTLLKKEFDIHRAKGEAHPLMKAYHIDAIPLAHEKLTDWRENFIGITYLHQPTNLTISGALDDIWVNPKKELIVVDYKATSTTQEITLDSEYRQAYKRQLEIYQWLLRQNGFSVSDTGYIVYCNGLTDKVAFDAKLEFHLQIIPYKGSDDWLEHTIKELKKVLLKDSPPSSFPSCKYCQYIHSVNKI